MHRATQRIFHAASPVRSCGAVAKVQQERGPKQGRPKTFGGCRQGPNGCHADCLRNLQAMMLRLYKAIGLFWIPLV